MSSSFIYELLERAHLNYSSKAAVSEALEQIIGHLTARQCGHPVLNHLANLDGGQCVLMGAFLHRDGSVCEHQWTPEAV